MEPEQCICHSVIPPKPPQKLSASCQLCQRAFFPSFTCSPDHSPFDALVILNEKLINQQNTCELLCAENETLQANLLKLEKNLVTLKSDNEILAKKLISEIDLRGSLLQENDALHEEMNELMERLFSEANNLVSDEAQRRERAERQSRRASLELEELRSQLSIEQSQLKELREKLLRYAADEEDASLMFLKEPPFLPMALGTSPPSSLPSNPISPEPQVLQSSGPGGPLDELLPSPSAPLPLISVTSPLSPQAAAATPSKVERRFSLPLLLSLPPTPRHPPLEQALPDFAKVFDARLFVEFQDFTDQLKRQPAKCLSHPFFKRCIEEDVAPCIRTPGLLAFRRLLVALGEDNLEVELISTPIPSPASSSSSSSSPSPPSSSSRSPLGLSPLPSSTVASGTSHDPPLPCPPPSASPTAPAASPQLAQAPPPPSPFSPFPSFATFLPSPLAQPAPADECACCGFRRPLTYRYRLRPGEAWKAIDRFCRDRLVAVGDLYAFVRHVQQGLLGELSTQSLFHEFCRLRRQIFYARIGCLPLFPTRKRFLSGLMDQRDDPFGLRAHSPTWSGGTSEEELSSNRPSQEKLEEQGQGLKGGEIDLKHGEAGSPCDAPLGSLMAEATRLTPAAGETSRGPTHQEASRPIEGEAWFRFLGRLRGQKRGRRVEELEPIEELHEHGEGLREAGGGERRVDQGAREVPLQAEEEEEMEEITISDDDDDDLVVDIEGQLPRLLEEAIKEGAGRHKEEEGEGAARGNEATFFPGFSLPSRKEHKINGLPGFFLGAGAKEGGAKGGGGKGGLGRGSNGLSSFSKLFQRTASPSSTRKDLSFFEPGVAS